MFKRTKSIIKSPAIAIILIIVFSVALYFLYPNLLKKQDIQQDIREEGFEKALEFQKLEIQRAITNQEYYEYTHGVISPIFSSKDEKLLYVASDLFALSKVYSLDINTQQRKELSDSFGFVSQVIWSPDYNYAIIQMNNLKYELGKERSDFLINEAPNGASTFWFYDANKDKIIYLDWKIQAVSWSPQGDRIAYIYQEDKKHYALYISNPDGSKSEKIIDLKGEGVEYFKNIEVADSEDNYLYYWDGGLNWSPRGNKIIYWGKGSPGLILVGLDRKEEILKQAEIIDGAQWSPNGELILYSAQQMKDIKVILALLIDKKDGFEEEIIDNELEFNVQRCVWSKKNTKVIYCLSLDGLGNKFYEINLDKKEIAGLVDLNEYESTLFKKDSLFLAWVEDKNDKDFLLQEKKRKINEIFLDSTEEKLYFRFFRILYAINLNEEVQDKVK